MSKRSDDYGKKSYMQVKRERIETYKKKVREKTEKIERKRLERRSSSPSSFPLSLVSSIVGIFVFVIVAVALLPILTGTIEEVSSGANLSKTDEEVLGLWPVFIIMGVLLATLAAVGLS